MAMEKARQLLVHLAATPDSAITDLPFLHRALLLPLLTAASALLHLCLLFSPTRTRGNVPVPVVSVGNLAQGGYGKTPMVDFLACSFHTMAVSPLILTRVAPELASRCGNCDGQWIDTLGKCSFNSSRTNERTVECT